MQKAVDKIGILSLSEDPLNMLMWGHYAESHKGLCLKFAVSESEAFFGRAQTVVYSVDRPRFDPSLTGDTEAKNASAAVLTKSIDWMYELEWRILNEGSDNYKFPRDKLVGIIFGYRMAKAEREQVSEMATKGNLGAVIYEAVPDQRKYRMRLQILK